ncbi:MAG: DUF2332 domain-containing protein [Nocardioides sp.]
MEIFLPVAESYAAFAVEAADSPCFRDWASSVAADTEIQALIATLPPVKQQANLVFAAARWHGVPAPGPYEGLRAALLEDWDTIRGTVLARSTQTNEVGRLATLVPVLAGLDGPLALIEAGASAGLCLYPDRWGYAWTLPDGSTVTAGAEPRLACEVTGEPPLPSAPPEVAWRAGIDLHPLDVTDPDAMAWLQILVWPEQVARRERLAAAIEVARPQPPYLVEGNLLDALPALLDEVPAGTTPVVFHSAVIAYLETPDRERFQALMTGLVAEGRCVWVSNEGPRVLPEVAATGPLPPPGPLFVLGVDGRAVAHAHGHGRTLHWLA